MSEWREVALGDVIRPDIESVRVEDDDEYPIVGVLNRGRGLLHRDPLKGSETRYAKLHVIRRDQVVYSKLKAFEGAVTVATGLLSAPFYASPEFPTYTCGSEILPAYARLITQLPSFWSDLANLSTGMGGRRERVSPSAFLTVRIPLPPVEVQRRIVDLVGALDGNIAALGAERGSSLLAMDALRDTLFSEISGEDTAPLGEVSHKIGSGATPRGGQSAYVPEGTSLIRSQNVRQGHFTSEGLAHIAHDAAAALANVAVEESDVLVNITGASVARVCLAPEHALPARVNQHVAIVRPDQATVIPQFVSHWLLTSAMQEKLWQMASGGSTREALTKSQLQGLEVPLVPLEVQRSITATLEASTTHLRSCKEEIDVLREMRSNLLPALLSGSHLIPESYDTLFELQEAA